MTPLFQQWLSFFSADPILRLIQGSLLFFGVIAVYLVCFVTRDIILRTRSFLYQLASILLVACLPVVGFFLYLLIRPSQTIKQRSLQNTAEEILKILNDEVLLADEEDDEEDPIVLPPTTEETSVPVSVPNL